MTTNKRLYFTCPIKALYMMKEFGVKFECKYTLEEIAEYEPLHEFYDFNEAACESNMIEDLLEDLENFCEIYVKLESEDIFQKTTRDVCGKIGNSCQIILRGDKQFFEPEVLLT